MTAISFPLYLLPSIPFRRRRPSTTSTSTASTTSSPSTSPPTKPTTYLTPPRTSYLRCKNCHADLLPTTSIISKGFTGRHGRAYLVCPPCPSTLYQPSPLLPSPPSHLAPPDTLPNTKTHKPQPRQLVTGAHTVSDISCVGCGQVLGWKYVDAVEESQKYKVGKFILETKRVVRCVAWEGEDEGEYEELIGGGGGGGAVGEDAGMASKGLSNGAGAVGQDDDIEFDSQDEDECEDLFAGVWTRNSAVRRRREKTAFA